MHSFVKIAAVAAIIAGLSYSPLSLAQAEPFSNTEIIARCTAPDIPPGTCAQLVTAKIKALQTQGLTAAQIDAALADLVIAHAEAGLQTQGAALTELLAGISIAQSAISDPGLVEQITLIAEALQSGDNIETAAIGEQASPN